jgi:hypothetical protein
LFNITKQQTFGSTIEPTRTQVIKNIFCAGWYHLRDNKIDLIRAVFDPLPLPEK